MQKIRKIAVCMIVFMMASISLLTGCVGNAPDPQIKEGRFDFSIVYEIDGEVTTLSSVYVCEFVESGWLMGGWYIDWNAYVEDAEIEALFHDESYYGGIMIGNNEDGTIYLDLCLDPGYFMSEPGGEDRKHEPYLFIMYTEEAAERIGTYGDTDVAILESYGAKLISYEYASPIENIYE
jgi:hypothetical protein